jgi:hypothetical protein
MPSPVEIAVQTYVRAAGEHEPAARAKLIGFRVASVIDAAGTTFRYRSIVQRRDGTSVEFFDAGEIDADGRIATLLVFAGPLADVV